MKFKKRSLAKTFKNTSFQLFALQPSTGFFFFLFFYPLKAVAQTAESSYF